MRLPTILGKLYSIAATIISCLLLIPAHGEVITDGMVGARLNIQGPDFVIQQSLGSTVGSNLFHSFQSFNINNSQSATFTGSHNISNVISRVTGGQSSTIDGALRSQIGRANFYFINPAGILFGPNASINVPAAFHASTAANLQFSDGAVFSAVNPSASTLSMANPSAFGFVANRSADIRIEKSQLLLTPETETSLSGREVVITHGTLINEAGKLHLTAVGTNNEQVSIDSEPFKNTIGAIRIDTSRLDVSGNGAGSLIINGGDISMINSKLFANNLGNNAPQTEKAVLLKASSLLINNTLISSDVKTTDTGTNKGDAGNIKIEVTKAIDIRNGGKISSDTFSAGNAGTISIQTANLNLDAKNSMTNTEISSEAEPDSTGDGGNINIQVTNKINLINGGKIVGSTFSEGNAGSVSIQTKDLNISNQDAGSIATTGIFNEAQLGSSGDAGNINVQVSHNMNVINRGKISGNTFSEGNAGSVNIQAAFLNIDSQNSGQSTTGIFSDAERNSSGDAGKIDVEVSEDLAVVSGGKLSSDTFSNGKAGSVTIRTRNLNINTLGSQFDTEISSEAEPESNGDAGNIDVMVSEHLNLTNGGRIISSTFSDGKAGFVAVTAKHLTIDNQNNNQPLTGIFSEAQPGSKGNAGNVDVAIAEDLMIVKGGKISSDTFAQGNAGSVTVQANDLTINAQNSPFDTEISSEAEPDSTGNAGNINVKVNGSLNLVNGGRLISSTFAEGSAGSLSIQASNLNIDGQGNGIDTGIFSEAQSTSKGNAGNINVDVAERLNLLNGGKIISSTFSTGKAGSVNIQAKFLNIENQESGQLVTGIFSEAQPGSKGNAGNVDVSVAANLNLVNGAKISSDTFAKGNAGLVTVQASYLSIDAQGSPFDTEISSEAEPNSNGNAGNITVNVNKNLNLVNGGRIISSTFAEGSAGSLSIHASSINIDAQGNRTNTGIFSEAQANSQGSAGNINVNASKNLSLINGGVISILTSPFVATDTLTLIKPTTINIQAKHITLENNATITAQSRGNVPASNIFINALQLTANNRSKISTAANEANGGNIEISGGNTILTDSQLTTSVQGNGNGGNITLNPAVLVLNSGFIQANTNGIDAKGGAITVNSQALISSQNQLEKAGNTPIVFQPGLNVIQAAAQTGVSGNIDIVPPQLNISGTLTVLDTELINIDSISKSPCSSPGLQQSKLINIGKGGLPDSVEQVLPVQLTPHRLHKILDQSISRQPLTLSSHTRNHFEEKPCM